MGTNNRAFNRHSRRSAMSNTARNTRRRESKRELRRKENQQSTSGGRSFFGHVKYGLNSLLSIFGFGRSRNVHASKPMPSAAFRSPTHSAHLCGRRTPEERQQRKARRQKRTKLILRRGYA